MLLVITIWTYIGAARRSGSCFQVYGPTILAMFATIFVMADLTRHVMQDTGFWPAPGSSEYKEGCHEETFHCLNTLGWVFTVVFTYLGFTLLMVSSFWNANICEKISNFKAKWDELRSGDEEDV